MRAENGKQLSLLLLIAFVTGGPGPVTLTNDMNSKAARRFLPANFLQPRAIEIHAHQLNDIHEN